MKGVIGAALAVALIVAGCGDDDSASDTQAFCSFIAEGHETGAPPDGEAFDRLEELAPREVSEEVSDAADLFREKGTDAYDDREFLRIDAAIEEWESENCPEPGTGDE